MRTRKELKNIFNRIFVLVILIHRFKPSDLSEENMKLFIRRVVAIKVLYVVVGIYKKEEKERNKT